MKKRAYFINTSVFDVNNLRYCREVTKNGILNENNKSLGVSSSNVLIVLWKNCIWRFRYRQRKYVQLEPSYVRSDDGQQLS